MPRSTGELATKGTKSTKKWRQLFVLFVPSVANFFGWISVM
jgi:hypothetical protein